MRLVGGQVDDAATNFTADFGYDGLVCSDGFKEGNEQCDDGNLLNGDGCSSTCQIEIIPPVCGNHIIETGETCDDGNLLNGDGCNSTCQTETSNLVCGNNIVENGEQCDDGNTNNGDGCNSTCQTEIINPICGNGNIELNEGCDDGNLLNGDGCSSTCTIEITNPICGNHIIETGETCDDGNILNGDGCNSTCQTEVIEEEENNDPYEKPSNINAPFIWGSDGKGDGKGFTTTKGGIVVLDEEAFKRDAYILVTWKDNAKGEFVYISERSVNGGSFEKLDSLDKNTEKYLDYDIEPNNTYAYRVFTKLNGDDGQKSKKVSVLVKTSKQNTIIVPEEEVEKIKEEEKKEEKTETPKETSKVEVKVEEAKEEKTDYMNIIEKSILSMGAAAGLYGLLISALTAFPINPLTTSTTSAIFRFFALPFGKKRHNFQVVVFDAVTKQPVPNIPVQIVDSKTGLTQESVVTDEEGRYGFLPIEGDYLLVIRHPKRSSGTP